MSNAAFTLLAKWRLMGESMQDKKLTNTARMVLYALLERTNHATGCCWPSYPRLMMDTALSRESVKRGIALLRKEDYVSYWQGGGNRPSNYPGKRNGTTNRYFPRLPKEWAIGGIPTDHVGGANGRKASMKQAPPCTPKPYNENPSINSQNYEDGATLSNQDKGSTTALDLYWYELAYRTWLVHQDGPPPVPEDFPAED